jgi:hypothetical protein
MWADANPHAYRQQHFQREFSINLWAGLVGNYVIGPFELPHRLNGNSYYEFLTRDLPGLLEEVPQQLRRDIWFMHDAAPPHFSVRVRNYLNHHFRRRWIGRNDPHHWPARSPDLTPMDFYFWGHIKELVYKEGEVETMEELRNLIFNAAEVFRQDGGILEHTRTRWVARADVCIHMNGHFQHLL